MDDSNMHANDRKSGPNTNGSARRSLGSSQLQQGSPVRPTSLMDSPSSQHPGAYTIIQVVVNRDDKGYGMKVSGDNPVYVQSVKQGGAAEKAGLYAGDKIIEVNGENVMSSTHTDVVSLIRSASQVVLTVQQRIRGKRMESPSLQSRSMTSPSSHQITGPQPVDGQKMHQLKVQKKQHISLMIEKEERYLEMLRSQLALSPNDKKHAELEKTERNLIKLQGMLQGNLVANEQSPPPLSRNIFSDIPNQPHTIAPSSQTLPSKKSSSDEAPPLPKRNRPLTGPPDKDANGNRRNPNYANGLRAKSINNNNNNKCVRDGRVDDQQVPPPLPPRNQPRPQILDFDLDAANSIGKQLSYPLVTTCATLINNYTSNHTHHRTKSSPESLHMMTLAEASRRLIASESTTDLGADGFGENATPPGTPPPPYPHASPEVMRKQSANRESEVDSHEDHDPSFSTSSLMDTSNILTLNSSDIKAASSHVAQQQIISMEDDEMSDQEVNQLDDHGPFKSLSRLWEHRPHLAVFMNYVLLNSDPNSLLFYLLTNLYKEGNAKDMRKWAYEIHSSFLVPGAPLRLANVDENIAHEIDDNLMREYDKEEILRKIFWKPRARAKEELTRQLNHFQQKRTAGLGTMYGPPDAKLYDMNHEKARELKIYENLLVDKLEPYLEEVERENYDPKKYYTAAALATVIIRIFGVRAVHPLDRFPTFVNKEKAFRPKFMNMKYSRKLTIQGHQFTAQQYYTVIACNHCHQIIYGIGPQGYQCSVCLINLHRMCVRLYEDSCPGPINKKDRGIQKVMEKIHRRKPSNQTQLDRRQDDKDNAEGTDSECRKKYIIQFSEKPRAYNFKQKVCHVSTMPNKKRKDVTSSKKPIARTNSTTTNAKTEKKPTGKNAPKTNSDKTKVDRKQSNANSAKKPTKTEKLSDVSNLEPTVEIRNDPTRQTGELKRYSDSFIVAGCNKVDSDNVRIDSNLSRSRSGIFTEFDTSEKDLILEKSERKTRRFSDIFTKLRSADSTENLKAEIKMRAEVELSKKKASATVSDKKKSKGAPNSKIATRTPSIRSEKLNSENNSYLKRVKSKICRTKNDTEGVIYENDENLKLKKDIGGSMSNFDLLIRQTSNLERGRSGMFGHKKCVSNVGIGETTTTEKPVLAKSKSSSAINLGLLRTRRNKIMEQLRNKNCKTADGEFTYMPFITAHGQLSRNLSVDLITEDTVDHAVRIADDQDVKGDMKASHSLSRTDSDRRADAKTDTPTQDGQDHGQNTDEDLTNVESTKSLPAPSDKKKNSSSINRSESVKESSEKQKKQRRNFSDPLRPHNIGDSANLETAVFWSGSTGSSSNSSINSNSRCSNDSPSTGNTGCDSDGINEADLNDWQSGLTPEEQHRIPPHEKQRQEIINELLSTEISHVRNLRILDQVFLRGIKERGLLKEDELLLVFPNLPDVKKIHIQFTQLLREKKKSLPNALWKDIGDVLLQMFNGDLGDKFQKAAATFCEKQQAALDLIKEKRKKDPKFNVGLNDLEQNKECRRLPLQGFILTEMQRLSKYPMIIERLIGTIEKSVQADGEQEVVEYSSEELRNLTLAAERAREIINHVNEAAKRAWGKFRLQEIQNHLDTSQFYANKEVAIVSEFKSIDLTTYTLLHEGTVQLKRQNKAHQPLHMLLLEEAVIFLLKDGDQRFVLKFFQCGKPGQTDRQLPPIIRMSTLLFRNNAATDCSIFLVNTSTLNSNMYELLTKDNSERKTWITHLNNAKLAHERQECKTTDSETVGNLPNIRDVAERAETIGGTDVAVEEESEEQPQNNEEGNEDASKTESAENDDTSSDNDTVGVGSGVTTKFTADEWPLIQPSEVHANIPPVHFADAVLTPLEQLNRKNDEVRKALEDREKLVADIFNIPHGDYHHIMDMASEESKIETDVVSKEPTDLVLTSLYQLDQLLKAVNESYVVTDADELLLKSGGKGGQSCASNPKHVKKDFVPQAASIIHGVQGSLTQLLSVMKSREEERVRLRKELERTREQLHAKLSLECSTYSTDTIEEAPPDLVQSGDLEIIQESLTENEAN